MQRSSNLTDILPKIQRIGSLLNDMIAGQDGEATERARSYFTGYRPSSPSVALLRDGKVVFMLERSAIEGCDPNSIAQDLTQAFDRFCAPANASPPAKQ